MKIRTKRGDDLECCLEELENADIKGLEDVGGVGREAKKVDLVLPAHANELVVRPSLVPVREEDDVVIGVGADGVSLGQVVDARRGGRRKLE